MPRAKHRLHKEASDEIRSATEWYLARSVEAAEGFSIGGCAFNCPEGAEENSQGQRPWEMRPIA